jgi:hypothetical protein
MEGLKSLLEEHEHVEEDNGYLAGDLEFIKSCSSVFSPKAKEMRDQV